MKEAIRQLSLSATSPGTELTPRAGLRVLVLLTLGSALFAGVSVLLEAAAGHPIISGSLPGTAHSAEDAVWHLATGFLLVLPARRRLLLWLGPLLGLGIDADHLFGGVLPTVIFRESHSLIFLALIVIVLYRWTGWTGAALGAGGFLVHLSVDGGLFPLLSPVAVGAYPLPFAAQVLGIGLSAVCSFLAVRPVDDLGRPTRLLPLVAVVAILTLLTPYEPGLRTFNGA